MDLLLSALKQINERRRTRYTPRSAVQRLRQPRTIVRLATVTTLHVAAERFARGDELRRRSNMVPMTVLPTQ
jgi:hypothetical protein